MRRILVASLLTIRLFTGPAFAVQPDEIMADPANEARARAMSRDLRCMVCQNQSIDDSDAPLARDLRLLVRERIAAGDSDAQVQTFLVSRYGDFVLLKPPVAWRTALLWGTPVALLLLGGLGLASAFRRRAHVAATPALSDDEARRLADLTKH